MRRARAGSRRYGQRLPPSDEPRERECRTGDEDEAAEGDELEDWLGVMVRIGRKAAEREGAEEKAPSRSAWPPGPTFVRVASRRTARFTIATSLCARTGVSLRWLLREVSFGTFLEGFGVLSLRFDTAGTFARTAGESLRVLTFGRTPESLRGPLRCARRASSRASRLA